MDYETFCKVVTKLKSLDAESENYIDALPYDIGAFIADNTFSNTKGLQVDLLMAEVFGPTLEDVCWFLYEFNEKQHTVGDVNISVEGRDYEITNLESYLDYAKTELFNTNGDCK